MDVDGDGSTAGSRVPRGMSDLSFYRSPAAASVCVPIRTGMLGVGMRLTAWVLSAVVVVMSTAACGSSGTHPQSFTPSPTPTASFTSSPTSDGPSNSAPGTTGAGAPNIPTPTVTPPAQGAVDAYIAMGNAYTAAARNPASADLAAVNRYLTGKALTLIDDSLRAMKSAGQAYRGTPADPRVKVETIFSGSSVFLSSCPLENKSDPFMEFYIATGKPIVVPSRTPPPPYRVTLPMRLIGSQWKLADILQNVGKTCTP